MEIMDALNKRYSTKKFDQTKKISDDKLAKIEELLQKSPSSVNVQPWHFIIATSDEGKKRIAKATVGGFKFNESKVLKSSATIIFASKYDISMEYMKHLLEVEDKDGRFEDAAAKEGQFIGREFFANVHKLDKKDQQHWIDKQLYLNLGGFLLGVAALGLDAVPMEGLDMKTLDEEFDLREKGFTSSVVVSIGYHDESDFNANLPKSRLPKEEIIERV